MVWSTEFSGALRALSAACDYEEFEHWLEETNRGSPDDYFDGYKILVRTCIQAFEDKLDRVLADFNIESNREYELARTSIADINSVRANSEAANLIKYLNEFDTEIYTAHDFKRLCKDIDTLRSEVITPFQSLLSRVVQIDGKFSEENYKNYLALFSLVTYANDTTRGYPEAFQYGWFDLRRSPEEFDDAFEQYKIVLYWIYSKLEFGQGDIESLGDEILSSESWKNLNSTFQSARQELLEPFERDNDVRDNDTIRFKDTDRNDEIEHLLHDAPDPAVGKQKALDRLFRWDYVSRGNQVFSSSGAGGILLVLFGLQDIRDRLDTDRRIQIRRLKHPVEPGFDYSYGIEVSGWELQGAGTVNGWPVFIHAATDYSGFGGSQHRLIEEYLQSLKDEGVVEIEQMVVEEDFLVHYVENDTSMSPTSTPDIRKSKYDERELTRIIRGGEDERTEFKEEFSGSATELAKEIAALANHKGGVLIFGIEDIENEVVGVDDVDTLDNRVSGILRNNLNPPLDAEIHSEQIQDDDLLIIDIPDVDRPVAMNYIYYIRNGRNVRKLHYAELKKRFG